MSERSELHKEALRYKVISSESLWVKFNPRKATDDSQKTDDLDGDDIERAAGFNFAKLKERYPELKTEIRKFAKYASDTSSEIQPMKAWQMGDLSLQASVFTVFYRSV